TAPSPVCACSEKIPLAARPVARDACKRAMSGPPRIASGHTPCPCREPRETSRKPQPTRSRIRSAQTRGVSRPPPLRRSHARRAARLVQSFADYTAAMRPPPAVTLREVPARQNPLIETPSLGAAPFNTSPSARAILSSPCFLALTRAEGLLFVRRATAMATTAMTGLRERLPSRLRGGKARRCPLALDC